MDKHKTSASLGARTGSKMIELIIKNQHETNMCPLCYAGSISLEMLSMALADKEVSEEEMIEYLEDLMSIIHARVLSTKKGADQPDPPQVPDKRKLI